MKNKNRQRYIKRLDKIFSEFIRLRDSDKQGDVICPLCGKRVFRKEAQNMHFISRGVLKYRYDEENCYAGCFRCNVILNGNYINYTLFMINKFGKERVEAMKNDKQPYNLSTPDLIEKIGTYKEKVAFLLKQKILVPMVNNGTQIG